MIRTFVGLLFAGVVVAGAVLAPGGSARAQVVIQGQGQAGGVYGQGTVYVQPGQVQAQPSPYVAGQQPTQPQPVRTIVHTEPTKALLVPGVIALGAGWLISGLGSLAVLQDCYSWCPEPSGEWAGYGWIPVIGPWLAYGLTYPNGYEWFNILFGVVQDVGLILMVLGLVIQQEWEEAIYAGVDLGEGRSIAFSAGGSGTQAQVGATLTF